MHGRIPIIGLKVSADTTKSYFVRSGLTTKQKESVALTIFMEVSIASRSSREHSSIVSRRPTAASVQKISCPNSSAYIAVRPNLGNLKTFVKSLCREVSVPAALDVWDKYGSVGKNKNRTFKPEFFECKECKGEPKFPSALEQIEPAKKGQLFADWTQRRGRRYPAH